MADNNFNAFSDSIFMTDFKEGLAKELGIKLEAPANGKAKQNQLTNNKPTNQEKQSTNQKKQSTMQQGGPG